MEDLESPGLAFMTPARDLSEDSERVLPQPTALFSPGMEAIINSPKAVELQQTFKERVNNFENGYDSDGELGPFDDAVAEELKESSEIDDPVLPVLPTGSEINDNQQTVDCHIPEDQIKKYGVKELKEQLQLRGIKIQAKWRKGDLVENLKIAVEKKMPIIGKTGQKVESINGFPPGSYWMPLVGSNIALEPTNAIVAGAYAPTNRENFRLVPKINFAEKIDVPVFTGTYKVPKLLKNGRHSRHPKSKLPLMEERVIGNSGIPKETFVSRFNLGTGGLIHPAELFDLFVPLKSPWTECNFPAPSIEKWTNYTNMKALLANAGTDGDFCYPDFKPFTPKELRAHIGVYILNGLNISPSVEKKFKTHAEDPVHGNDFVCRSIGPNAERRHRHFKAFFAVQDPRIPIPDRKAKPNWKIQPLLKFFKKKKATDFSVTRCVRTVGHIRFFSVMTRLHEGTDLWVCPHYMPG